MTLRKAIVVSGGNGPMQLSNSAPQTSKAISSKLLTDDCIAKSYTNLGSKTPKRVVGKLKRYSNRGFR